MENRQKLNEPNHATQYNTNEKQTKLKLIKTSKNINQGWGSIKSLVYKDGFQKPLKTVQRFRLGQMILESWD